MDTLLEMQPRAAGGGGGGVKIEDIIYQQAGEMYDKIPKAIAFDPK